MMMMWLLLVQHVISAPNKKHPAFQDDAHHKGKERKGRKGPAEIESPSIQTEVSTTLRVCTLEWRILPCLVVCVVPTTHLIHNILSCMLWTTTLT